MFSSYSFFFPNKIKYIIDIIIFCTMQTSITTCNLHGSTFLKLFDKVLRLSTHFAVVPFPGVCSSIVVSFDNYVLLFFVLIYSKYWIVVFLILYGLPFIIILFVIVIAFVYIAVHYRQHRSSSLLILVQRFLTKHKITQLWYPPKQPPTFGCFQN